MFYVSFYSRDNVNTLFSNLYDETSLTWSLTFGSSAPTDITSSSNSHFFVSDSTRDTLFGVPPAVLINPMALTHCTETLHVELSLPTGPAKLTRNTQKYVCVCVYIFIRV